MNAPELADLTEATFELVKILTSEDLTAADLAEQFPQAAYRNLLLLAFVAGSAICAMEGPEKAAAISRRLVDLVNEAAFICAGGVN